MMAESQQYLVKAASQDVHGAKVFVSLSKSNARWICKRLIRRIQACGMPHAFLCTLSKTLNEGRCEGQEVKRLEARRLPLLNGMKKSLSRS